MVPSYNLVGKTEEIHDDNYHNGGSALYSGIKYLHLPSKSVRVKRSIFEVRLVVRI